MSQIDEIVAPERVLSNVQARSMKHALEILSELLATATANSAPGEIFAGFFARERLGSTALGDGVSFPHARLAGVEQPTGALIRLSQPVNFDAPDRQPVGLIFGLLLPEAVTDDDLAELIRLAHMFSKPDCRKTLQSASTSRMLYEQLLACANTWARSA